MKVSCRKTFSKILSEYAERDPGLCFVATDSSLSATTDGLMAAFPGQAVELGVSEQNAVAFAAGMALAGRRVFVCGPACFLSSRAAEQVKVDVAYNRTDVKIVGVSAGVSYGPLGGTHTSLNDLALFRATAGLEILVPCDAVQTAFLTRYLASTEGPAYLRMGRGDVFPVYEEGETFTVGRAKTVLEGGDLTIIACGEMVYPAKRAAERLAAEGIRARLLDFFTIKPFDHEAVLRAARETRAILTVEEHSVHGGLGEAVAHSAAETGTPVKILGFPDEEIPVGSSGELFKHYGLDEDGIESAAAELLRRAAGK